MDLNTRLAESRAVIRWIEEHLDGLSVPELPTNKRVQLAGASFHAAIEHAFGIIVLVEERLGGPSSALIRVALEAWIRATWLASAATVEELDRAGRDDFPGLGIMISAMDRKTGDSASPLSKMKRTSWPFLCSYTHTGYQQLGVRLTTTGISSAFPDDHFIGTLGAAHVVALSAVAGLFGLAGDARRVAAALQRLGAKLPAELAEPLEEKETAAG